MILKSACKYTLTVTLFCLVFPQRDTKSPQNLANNDFAIGKPLDF